MDEQYEVQPAWTVDCTPLEERERQSPRQWLGIWMLRILPLILKMDPLGPILLQDIEISSEFVSWEQLHETTIKFTLHFRAHLMPMLPLCWCYLKLHLGAKKLPENSCDTLLPCLIQKKTMSIFSNSFKQSHSWQPLQGHIPAGSIACRMSASSL